MTSARVVLVTGVASFLGSRLAQALAEDPTVQRVIGLDTVSPSPQVSGLLGRTEFVRADIRNPLIAKVIAQAEVDTVVHLNLLARPLGAGGRSAMKEINVIGTMQLLAACQRAPSLRKLVVRSSTAVYGSSSRDPGLFTEQDEPRRPPSSGYAKDAAEVEGYVRGFGRRRPDVTLSVLRFTDLIGPTIQTSMTRYLSLPVVPTIFGFDPRIQLCHEDDGVQVLREMTDSEHPGTFNVGGAGILLLSQLLRRLGRPSFPVAPPAVSVLAQGCRRAGLLDFSPEQLRFLEHGRVADVSGLADELAAVPRPTGEAFEAFAANSTSRRIAADTAAAVQDRVLDLLAARRGGARVSWGACDA